MATKKASEETSTGALTGQRTLTKEIPSYNGTYDVPNLVFPALNNHGWYNEGLANGIGYETTIDLSGYTLDQLTFVPTGGMVQDPGRFVAENLADGDIEILDIVSSERLSLTEIIQDLLLGNLPGSPATNVDHSQIIFGSYRVMSTNQNYISLDICSTLNSGTFGSAEPTAVAKLWVYKIVRINGTKGPLTELRIPASRFILPGVVIKEKEIPYLQRLKRSYEISTQG